MKHFQKMERNFTFKRKRSDNQERNEIVCHRLIPATSAHSTETWLMINTFPRNICMSFTKYVEVVEKSAIMNMLPAKVII